MTYDPLPLEPTTDAGYANRLAEIAGNDFRYIWIWHQWRHWDGKRWAPDELGLIQERAKALARDMVDVAETGSDSDDKARGKRIASALAHESAAAISSVVKLASSHPTFACRPKDFDSSAMLLNMPNGVYDLRTHEIGPHKPELMLSKITAGSYDPEQLKNGHGKLFKRFLTRVQPSPENRQFLARLVGCMLEGRVTEQMLVVFHGTGANGKSTFNETMDYVLGNYATAADANLLSDPEAHPTAIANLVGRRVVLVNELGGFNESRVKMLTSQDTLTARRMREDFWTFSPTHNIVAATNDQPRVTGTSEGIWRRIQLVPWTVQLPRQEWDHDLALKLRNESDFIMTWLLNGYKRYSNFGLGIPSGVQAANVHLRDELDPVSAWIRECCTEGPGASEEASALWNAFDKWQVDAPRKLTQTAFGRSLRNKSYERSRGAGGRITWNLQLRV